MDSFITDKRLMATVSAFSILTLGAGLFRLFGGDNHVNSIQDKQLIEAQEKSISQQLTKLDSLQTLLAKKAQEMEIQYLNHTNVLTPQSLKQIFEFAASTVDKQQLLQIYTNNRKARRSCFPYVKQQLGKGPSEEIQTYFRFACTFEEQIQYLIEKTQKDFVVFLDIDYSVIIESIDYHQSSEGTFKEWIDEWSRQVKEELKQKLPLYQEPITPEQVLQAVKFQIQCLISEGQRFAQSVKDLNLQNEEQEDSIPVFLQLYLEDEVFTCYGFELEQANMAPEDMTPELQEQFHVLSELQQNILNNVKGEEVSQHSQEHSDI